MGLINYNNKIGKIENRSDVLPLGTEYTPPILSIPTMQIQQPYIKGPSYLTLKCAVTSDGGLQIIDRGVCWGITPNPVISDASVSHGINAGDFICDITELTESTLYYIRGYAINLNNVIIYSNQVIETTIEAPLITTIPTVNTISKEEDYSDIIVEGEIPYDGGEILTEFGIAVSEVPDVSNNATTHDRAYYLDSQTFKFTRVLDVGNEIENRHQVYYAAAYASNVVGTAYGEDIAVELLPTTDPIISITSIEVLSGYSASVTCAETTDPNVSYGNIVYLYSIYPGKYWGDDDVQYKYTSGDSTSIISNLQADSTYYIKPYLKERESNLIYYGDELTFDTPSAALPTITLNAIDQAADDSFIIDISLTNSQDMRIDRVGVAISETPTPTTSDKIIYIYTDEIISNVSIADDNNFKSIIEGLTSNKLLYVRPILLFFNNYIGTTEIIYGNILSATTLASGTVSLSSISLSFSQTDVSSEVGCEAQLSAQGFSNYTRYGIQIANVSSLHNREIDPTTSHEIYDDDVLTKKEFSFYQNLANIYYGFFSKSFVWNGGVSSYSEECQSAYIGKEVYFEKGGYVVVGLVGLYRAALYVNGEQIISLPGGRTVIGGGDSNFIGCGYMTFIKIRVNQGNNLIRIVFSNTSSTTLTWAPGGLLIWNENWSIEQLTDSYNPATESEWKDDIVYNTHDEIGAAGNKVKIDPYNYNPNTDMIEYRSTDYPHNSRTIMFNNYLNNYGVNTVSNTIIDYGDSNNDTLTGFHGRIEHTYASAGTYNVAITVNTSAGNFSRTLIVEVL